MSHHHKHKHKHREQVSLLVPFRSDGAERAELWGWMHRYWKHELPDAEIVVGIDHGSSGKCRHHRPFSKTAAVNDAFKRSHGDIIVILDADAYVLGSTITHCAERIRAARKAHVRMWFIPYRAIYRLTRTATRNVLHSDPKNPLRFSSPPPPEDIENTTGTSFGHKYGALIQVMPREAYELVHGMDHRFRGWGGEDVCFLRALDTLYTKHKNLPLDVLHLWHPNYHIGSEGALKDVWKTRAWQGQTEARMNDRLAVRYDKATNKPAQMDALTKEGQKRDWHWCWRFW